MFQRKIHYKLKQWAEKPDRRPLVLRGARQVGKTTVVNMFAKEFNQYINLNLEKPEIRKLIENEVPFDEMLMSVFLFAKKKRNGKKTLIFLDEIQNSPKAMALLRYFFEEAGDIYVIAAGSLLESVLYRNISFPVGRVEYMILRPCSFIEYLSAIGEIQLLELLGADEIPAYAHNQLMLAFNKYTSIGGMPRIVDTYTKKRDNTKLVDIYSDLLESYAEDVEKYANSSKVNYVRHIMLHAFQEVCNRITFERFGQSQYRSREMKEAFILLQKTLLIKLVYPLTNTTMPLQVNKRKKPRLHLLDTGLVNHVAGLHVNIIGTKNLNELFRGKIAEHIVGQELLADNYSVSSTIYFWTREKSSSSAEVDYIFPYNGMLIPVEVKSGLIGKLRSLHQFMDKSEHKIAIRIWSGKKSLEQVKTISGKKFTLLNLPFYMVSRIEKELNKIITIT